MKEYKNEIFEEFYDENSNEIFENISFQKCQFNYCEISQADNPFYRTTVKNINLFDCSLKGGSIGCSIIQEVTINNLKNTGLFQTWGAVFNQVILKGRIGKIMITNSINNSDPDIEKAFEEENKQFYSTIDWALDISMGEFIELDIRGIPADLIKINRENQAIIRKVNIPENLGDLNFKSRITPITLGRVLRMNMDDYVYVAPKRSKEYENILEDIHILRKNGIADNN